MKLFSGSSNIPLAKEVAKHLGISLSHAEITRFSNTETKVRIVDDVRNQQCVVVQSTANPSDTHILELLFFCDALKRQKAKKIIGVIPYFGYSKQDTQHNEGEAVSSEVILRALETSGYEALITFDLHSDMIQKAARIPFTNISAIDVLATHAKKYFARQKIDLSTITLVVPDHGAIQQGKRFAHTLSESSDIPLIVIDKSRSGESTRAKEYRGRISGPHLLIIDDMIVNGSTLVSAVTAIKKNHTIKTCTVAATHHDFTPLTQANLKKAHIDAIISTNSIRNNPSLRTPLLQEVSLAPLIADELRNLIQ